LSTPRPLVVDLDGSLLRSDTLIETGILFLRKNPGRLLAPLYWLSRGKVSLKSHLARETDLDVSTLPYDPQVLAVLRQARDESRPVVLATASHHSVAEAIAAHLQLFDEVIATDASGNLKGPAKSRALVEKFGEGQFDYLGNSDDDLPVWAAAAEVWIANPEPGTLAKARALRKPCHLVSTQAQPRRALLQAMRPHQWIKNALIFVPLLASHRLDQPGLVLLGLLAVLCFSLCASSVYLLNDLLDLPDDRYHPGKRQRPFAAGTLPIRLGIKAIPALLVAGFGLALLFLPGPFVLAMLSYYLLTLAYSIRLKRLVLVDVMTLAFLYTLRIVAGTYAFGVQLTFWMLAFSMFIFLSLALVKRYAELKTALQRGETGMSRGRGYSPDDLEVVSSLGGAAGYLSVLVLAMYIQDQTTIALYHYPQLIWFACPLLLYWISRTWLITHRGDMHDDPVVFAVKDRVSLLIGLLFLLTFWLAS
jgi:4-hydroxybenzoate polyprenyltransferase